MKSLIVAIAALTAYPAQARGEFELTETSIAATQQAIREHHVTCRQVIDGYLQRIRTYDRSESTV